MTINMTFNLKEAAVAIGGISSGDANISHVSTDTRTIVEGSLFVALEGENFDGHNYIEEAVKKGAVAVMVHRDVSCSVPTIKVDSTRDGYIALSGYYRDLLNIPVVAVTGSVGKTTTKDFISLVVSQGYQSHKSQGNENNQVGMPKTIFSAPDNTGALVLEMGMCGLGEIEELSLAAKPDVAVITNIGVSHLELLGSRENILKAKLEIISGLKPQGALILSADNDLLSQVDLAGVKTVFYGIDSEKATIKAINIKEEDSSSYFDVVIDGAVYSAMIPTLGRHNVNNALAAIAVGIELNISVEKSLESIKNYTPSGMRQKILTKGGIIFVEDCYNSSPDSVQAAMETLKTYPAKGKKIAVLGDMLEMGDIAEQSHKTSGRVVAENNVDMLLCYGNEDNHFSIHSHNTAKELAVDSYYFTHKKQMADYLLSVANTGDIVWVKASRGIKLEEFLQQVYETLD